MRARRGGGGRRGAGSLRRRPASPGPRRLSLAEAQFYARVYDPARKGSLAELRRRGCDEQEAEELFAAAYAKVMESVDPIERCFSAPQMVCFVKRACWRRLAEERRRGAQRAEPGARPQRLRPESPAEPPAELAEEREAVAIGREAMAMLPERDRLVFTRRHLQGLAPEEIVAEMPGLSMRTYRKLIQRANARVLEAYARIEAGERCAEMTSVLLRRYIAGESPPAERGAVKAHLAHCRACQQASARMRGYLLDVASGALLASSLGTGPPGAVPAHLFDFVSRGAQALGEAGRAARERLREALLRLVGALPGSGADPGVSQALGASSWRIASACTAGLAAGACVAAGVVPGIGVVGLAGHHRHHAAPPPRQAKALIAPQAVGVPEYSTPAQTTSGSERASSGASAKRAATAKQEATSAPRERTSTATPASGRQVGTEFGPESGQPAPSSGTSSSPSSYSQGTSVSNATTAKSGGSGEGSKSTSRSGAEFGM
jgi:DNA-directed RNA polymerase specialized sigma24 family protein